MIFSNVFNPNPTFTSVTITGLTSGRVVYVTTGGLLTDDGDLTFDGTNLTCGDTFQKLMKIFLKLNKQLSVLKTD